MSILSTLANIILPQRCLSCGKTGEIICDDCLYKLPREQSPYGITTVLSYSDPVVRKAIWLLKYRGTRETAKPLAKVIHERLLEDLSEVSQLALLGSLVPKSDARIIIIPVPLSKERLKKRGFNQSEVLAREIIKLDQGRSFELRTDILKKIKNTQSQVEIKNRAQRIENLKKAFAPGNGAGDIRGRIAVLLDDVTTTGTTLNECAKILRRAKPRQIIKVAIAH